MKSGSFVLFYFGVVILLAGSFLLLLRKRSRPAKLNMRKGNGAPFSTEKSLDFAGEEELNIAFNYNGHLWDAFEVLGVPAGSETAVVERAYQAALHSVGAGSKEIIELAYKAIVQRRTPRA